MVVNGSSGERYRLNGKIRHTFGNYTEYPVMGSGEYIARIFGRGQRKPVVEAAVKDAVYSGAYYDDAQPLNVLYIHNKFAGFLYQGEMCSGRASGEDEGLSCGGDEDQKTESGGLESGAFLIGLQVAAAVICAAVGRFIVYPVYQGNMNDHWMEFSSLTRWLSGLDYRGIPAVIAGIILHIFVLMKGKRYMDTPIIFVAAGFAGNLAGVILYTLLVTVLLFLIQGVIALIMKYLLTVLLIAGVFLWIRKKFLRGKHR